MDNFIVDKNPRRHSRQEHKVTGLDDTVTVKLERFLPFLDSGLCTGAELPIGFAVVEAELGEELLQLTDVCPDCPTVQSAERRC